MRLAINVGDKMIANLFRVQPINLDRPRPKGALVLGMAGFIALLAYVQFWLLPDILFELTDEPLEDPRALRAQKLGRVLGAIGWGVGAVFGLGGAIWSWWT